MHDRVGSAQRVEALSGVREIRHEAQAVRAAIVGLVDVEDIETRIAQMPDRPTPSLASASGDDDPQG